MTSVALPVGRDRNPLRTLAWAGIVLGLAAAFVALPPIAARSWVPSAILALLAAFAGVFALTRGERRFGWYAVAAAVGGLKDSVVNQVTGLHVPPRDPHASSVATPRRRRYESRHPMHKREPLPRGCSRPLSTDTASAPPRSYPNDAIP